MNRKPNLDRIVICSCIVSSNKQDFVQIITVFSCKLQGKRADKARKLVKELIEESENDGKNSKSNVSAK